MMQQSFVGKRSSQQQENIEEYLAKGMIKPPEMFSAFDGKALDSTNFPMIRNPSTQHASRDGSHLQMSRKASSKGSIRESQAQKLTESINMPHHRFSSLTHMNSSFEQSRTGKGQTGQTFLQDQHSRSGVRNAFLHSTTGHPLKNMEPLKRAGTRKPRINPLNCSIDATEALRYNSNALNTGANTSLYPAKRGNSGQSSSKHAQARAKNNGTAPLR